MGSAENKEFETDFVTIVDVGALGGVDKKWEQIPYKAVLFEPNPSAVFQERPHWLVIRSALSDHVGTRDFYVARKNSNSSCYKPNYALLEKYPNPSRYDTVEVVSLSTDTLDHVLASHNIDDIDHVKLDVQGHELAVLRGATTMFDKIVSIEIEVQFSPIYEGVPLFPEVDAFLRQHGFLLARFSHLEPWRNEGREELIWGDAIYIKDAKLLTPLKRQRLEKIMKVLLPSVSGKVQPMHVVRKVMGKGKRLLKRVLSTIGVLHPAEGIKIDAAAKAAHLLSYKPPSTKVFIETGTHQGDMIAAVGSHFKKVYSVELDRTFYQASRDRFKHDQHIQIVEGDSAEKIKTVLTDVRTPALFWLDAHGSGLITMHNAPILAELEAIVRHPIKDHVILIDDARHFDRSTIAAMRRLVRSQGYGLSTRSGLFIVTPCGPIKAFTFIPFLCRWYQKRTVSV